ncbi:hypothetical protein JX265_013590 [Neoarthrinium moseri]|uniref:DNA-directed RNA polymerase subunit n=1 Tax=Neoarthrinium moseri TaxID=1658444 RepID=A0A9P9W8E5_9PEZI|nr:hypothetical protein JX266_011706 [Neoarthrinium moseri]KAI1849584.1 hypothetical protein JX265_013590 [Neoarthrinium moseri]
MPSPEPEPAAAMAPEKKDKKSKREKGDHKSKKRHRDAEAQPEEERRHKRSKSEAIADDDTENPHADRASRKEQKRERRKQKRQSDAHNEQPANGDTSMADVQEPTSEPETGKKRKKDKKRHQTEGAADLAAAITTSAAATVADHEKEAKADRRSRKHRDKTREQDDAEDPPQSAQAEAPEDSEDEEAAQAEKKRRKKEKKDKRRKGGDDSADVNAMDVDAAAAATTSAGKPFGKLPEQPYPFFTQQVSQYLPLFPMGMIEPVDGYADQHLKPLLNHYVPAFKGVLLGYHDVRLGEAPGKGSLTENSDNSDEAVLESIDEYAVAFGWLTAKLDLFKPSRGAWMEGSVNMQTEGHLGVVCWGMFNASIEAGRLPTGWRWVSLLGQGQSKGKGREKTPEEAKLPTPDPADEGDDDVSQLHTTGYWVDSQGQRVRGTMRFQIKNFEVGVSGDYGYLSIEGTMLDEDAERQRVAEELEKLRRWKLKHGLSRKEQKRLPDFSMTKFGMDEEQEDESQRADIWKGSRPASETAE